MACLVFVKTCDVKTNKLGLFKTSVFFIFLITPYIAWINSEPTMISLSTAINTRAPFKFKFNSVMRHPSWHSQQWRPTGHGGLWGYNSQMSPTRLSYPRFALFTDHIKQCHVVGDVSHDRLVSLVLVVASSQHIPPYGDVHVQLPPPGRNHPALLFRTASEAAWLWLTGWSTVHCGSQAF